MAEFSFKRVLNLGLLVSAISMGTLETVVAQETESDWWFDIEFIAFKRDMLPGHPEDFSQTDFEFSDDTPFDLLTLDLFRRANREFRLAAALPHCDPSKRQISFEALKIKPFDVDVLLDQSVNFNRLDASIIESAVDPLENLIIDLSHAQFIAQQHIWLDEPLPTIPALHCTSDLEYASFNSVPQDYFANTPYRFGEHRILPNEGLFLDAFATRVFAQRELTPLIYTAWRQPVLFGEDNAAFYRIFAGEHLSVSETSASASGTIAPTPVEDTSSMALPKSARADFVIRQLTALDNALTSEQPIIWDLTEDNVNDETIDTPVAQAQWELDGLFKVYLDYVNRVPYLHVDTEFKHARLDIDANGHPTINNYPSKQRRRIISKQIHYFDHPAFGIIVRLERYQVPTVDQQDTVSEQN